MAEFNLRAQLADCLDRLSTSTFSPFEMLSSRGLGEKLLELILQGEPDGPPWLVSGFKELTATLHRYDTTQARVVVFGGGTGLSTIVGGDSRSLSWVEHPYHGLKEIFPQTQAIVCTTDDGGSTGELLRDFPLIGLGDIRHVLLSSVQKNRLIVDYGVTENEANQIAVGLFSLFNFRFTKSPLSLDDLLTRGGINLDAFPQSLVSKIMELLQRLFSDSRLNKALSRPHCLGNLLIVSAIYAKIEGNPNDVPPEAIRDGLRDITSLIGVPLDAVLPCTCSPSVLKMRYANGVVVTGEDKVATAHRGVPVDRVMVDFSRPDPHILPEVMSAIRHADIILFAPGSLFTSIVPVMQTPGLAQAVRDNHRAMKFLVANLWVQSGETDLATDDSGRRYYVSDLITAYHRNIPGGVHGLFSKILLLAMQEIPGNIIQSYAVEGKTPIYLDRVKVWNMGFSPIEASIFSREGLLDRKVRHDPTSFATAIKVLWAVNSYLDKKEAHGELVLPPSEASSEVRSSADVPCLRYGRIIETLRQLGVDNLQRVGDIIWRHSDIPLAHLMFIRGITIVDREKWKREQKWDNLYSFYEPSDGTIKIRKDLIGGKHFEVAFLSALGQSLLGNYALSKEIKPLMHGGELLGKVYHLTLQSESELRCYFSKQELVQYLLLSRMRQSSDNPDHFTRVVNGDEGFTPPGLLMGLIYSWYLNNRFSSYVEYKMGIARSEFSDPLFEHAKHQTRRRGMIDFFREVVFRQGDERRLLGKNADP